MIADVITISREFGAGGRTIAKGLSEKLGIPWYDRDFVTITAQHSGFAEEDILEEGEELSRLEEILDSVLNNVAAYNSSHDGIFKAQKESLLELAQSPCIIVGRCANVIYKNEGVSSFDVFLYADIDVRVERAKNIVTSSVSDIRKYVEKRDAYRENYYRKYAKSEAGRARDYNICLDTGAISYDKCIEMLVDIIK